MNIYVNFDDKSTPVDPKNHTSTSEVSLRGVLRGVSTFMRCTQKLVNFLYGFCHK